MDMPTPKQLLNEIARGQYDEVLEKITKACIQRSRDKACWALGDVKVGDLVFFNENIAPRYLMALQATVVSIGPDGGIRVSVPDSAAYGKYRGLKHVRVPSSCLMSAKTFAKAVKMSVEEVAVEHKAVQG